jgi:hypothetical protein
VTPKELKPVWFVLGDSTTAVTWGEENGLPSHAVFGLEVKRPGLFRRPVFGDVWASPMRLVVSSGLVVREARPQNELPDQAELEDLCLNGGIAPSSFQELMAYIETITQ